MHSSSRVFAADEPANPWFTWQYVQDNSADLRNAVETHIVLTVESVLIAMLGTVTGLVLGVVVSLSLIASINRLSEATVRPSLPVLELVGVLVAGVVLGVLAALIPARRSTRLDVLDAVQAT